MWPRTSGLCWWPSQRRRRPPGWTPYGERRRRENVSCHSDGQVFEGCSLGVWSVIIIEPYMESTTSQCDRARFNIPQMCHLRQAWVDQPRLCTHSSPMIQCWLNIWSPLKNTYCCVPETRVKVQCFLKLQTLFTYFKQCGCSGGVSSGDHLL